MAFNGNLLYFDNDVFPHEFIVEKSYDCKPKIAQDLDPFTNETGWTIRNKVEHEPTTIQFETRPLNNREMEEMMSFIESHYTSEMHEDLGYRDLKVTYFNPKTNSYDTEIMYFNTTLEYKIRRIDRRTGYIKYEPFTVDLIGY